MAKSDLGKKHLCPSCDSRFYDLNRKAAICPKCGTKVEPPKPTKTRRGVRTAGIAAVTKPVNAKHHGEATSGDVSSASEDSDGDTPEPHDDDGKPQEVEGGDEQENVTEDTSDIGGADDGMSEALEHVDEGVADTG
ncbi:MAG: TIGR02300 family protein [Rhodospirillales bacterium]